MKLVNRYFEYESEDKDIVICYKILKRFSYKGTYYVFYKALNNRKFF